MHVLTGPIYVCDAEPGDVLQVGADLLHRPAAVLPSDFVLLHALLPAHCAGVTAPVMAHLHGANQLQQTVVLLHVLQICCVPGGCE